MSQVDTQSRKRALKVVLVLIIGLMAGFRGPILSLFSGEEQHPKHQASVFFDAEDYKTLEGVFSDTEEVRVALAADKTVSVGGVAARISAALSTVDNPAVQGSIKSAHHAAMAIETDDIVAARSAFSALSEALFSLAVADPRLQSGWHVFRCPMADEFPKWFQAPSEMANPYMGTGMLMCGAADVWADVEKPAETIDDGAIAHYTCPMHPSVKASVFGACPICHMDLTPVTHEQLNSGDIIVDSVRRQRIGVRTAVVERRSLERDIRAVGEVVWDEGRVVDVTARVEGFVEEMVVDSVGVAVVRSRPLLRLYSPELLAGQTELLAAQTGSTVAASVRRRLALWGMSLAEIDAVVKAGKARDRVAIVSPISGVVVDKAVNDGSHVAAGDLLYRLVDPTQVWVLAEVFEQDLQYLVVGQNVKLSLPHQPGLSLVGEVAHIHPSLTPGSGTGRVRVVLDNTEGLLRPGLFANVDFQVSLGEQLVVPADAVIYTGPRRLVFVDKGEGRLGPVEVQIGARNGEWVVIKAGLSQGDIVVSSGAFLLAAESRIRSAAGTWESQDAH
jgi:Cu(I)/Ag(I) efflux system membrane fusion protein